MEKLVNIYLFGKKYEVPENLTIMTAMEYAGYQLVRGCGCRNGFCGACATIYRIKGDKELKACLACQTKVEDNMYIATLPFFPLVKEGYDIENMMPYLCRYLGHKTIDETHYYYHLAAAATDIIRSQDTLSDRVIPEVTDYEEI